MKTHTLRKLFLLAFLPLALFAQGCFFGPGVVVGDLDLDWTFDGLAACPNDVDRVIVRIDGRNEVSAPCTAGGTVIPALPAGNYTVRLVGIDAFGDASWESAADVVSVIAGGANGYTFDLDPL